jgi:RNA polymerase sigma factor for flagellar operon FliA
MRATKTKSTVSRRARTGVTARAAGKTVSKKTGSATKATKATKATRAIKGTKATSRAAKSGKATRAVTASTRTRASQTGGAKQTARTAKTGTMCRTAGAKTAPAAVKRVGKSVKPSPAPAVAKTNRKTTAPEAVEARPALNPGNSTREECLHRYLPLVRYVVERVASGIPRHVDHEDLVSAGVLGLLNAYDKFDNGKGTKFETYAVWRIRGAVLDQLRSLDWASRSTRRMGREMETCARALDQEFGRTATDQEIARAMQIKLADYYRLMDKVRGSALVSLDETRHGEEGDSLGLAELLEDPRTPDVLANIEQEETKNFLHATLRQLPEQERLVMALYYYEQMTLREIGEALSISESRVSQIHTRAVERLRGRVGRALAS